jgi:hypothetical protein
MSQEILPGYVNEVTNNIVHCTVMYVTDDGITPTREILPLEFFSWVPVATDSFDMIINVTQAGRVLDRIICTSLSEAEVRKRNKELTKLHSIDKEWTIADIDSYIDQVMYEIAEETRKKKPE